MPKIIRNGITYSGLPSINYDCEISTITLYASNWSEGVYTITDSRIDATSVQEYLPGLGITDTQLEALQAANIADYGQDVEHAYLKAYGDVPEIDIPIRIMFNPGMKTKDVNISSQIISSGQITSNTSIEIPENGNYLIFASNYQSNNHYFRLVVNGNILKEIVGTNGTSTISIALQLQKNDIITFTDSVGLYNSETYCYYSVVRLR